MAQASLDANRQWMFQELIALVLDGLLRLTADAVLPLKEPAAAIKAAATPGRQDKVMFKG